MGILRRFREWREDKNGVLTGPDIDADSVSTDRLDTEPTGSLVTLDGSQTVSNNTITTLDFAVEDERGTVSNLLSNNVVVVPSGVSYARIAWSVRWNTELQFEAARPTKNGNPFDTDGLSGTFGSEQVIRELASGTAWFDVSENDELGFEVRQQSGSNADIEESRTYMEVWFL
jgi:hypothetical protein